MQSINTKIMWWVSTGGGDNGIHKNTVEQNNSITDRGILERTGLDTVDSLL